VERNCLFILAVVVAVASEELDHFTFCQPYSVFHKSSARAMLWTARVEDCYWAK
jgi:hypothetical protein